MSNSVGDPVSAPPPLLKFPTGHLLQYICTYFKAFYGRQLFFREVPGCCRYFPRLSWPISTRKKAVYLDGSRDIVSYVCGLFSAVSVHGVHSQKKVIGGALIMIEVGGDTVYGTK